MIDDDDDDDDDDRDDGDDVDDDGDDGDDGDDDDGDDMTKLNCAYILASSVYIFGVTTHIRCDRDDDSSKTTITL